MTDQVWGQFPAPGAVRFERLLPGPIERVWSYLADSDLRGQWLAPGLLESRAGGSLELSFRHSELSPQHEDPPEGREGDGTRKVLRCEVLEIDPPHRLCFTWGAEAGASVVLFELTPVGADVRLLITQSGLSPEHRVGVSNGWHTHLAILEDRANGRVPAAFWAIWKTLGGAYAERSQLQP